MEKRERITIRDLKGTDRLNHGLPQRGTPQLLPPNGKSLGDINYGQGDNSAWLEDAPAIDVYTGANSQQVSETVSIIFAVIMAGLGVIREPHRLKEMLKCALINLCVAYRNGTSLRYSRNKNDYTQDKRYGMLFRKYDRMLPIFDGLEANGYIIQKGGFFNPADKTGRQTRAWATDKLIQAFEAWDIGRGTTFYRIERDEVIILKNSVKIAKGYADNQWTNQRRINNKNYNEFMKGQAITAEIPGDAEVSFINLDSIQRSHNKGIVSINNWYPINQVLPIQDYHNNIYPISSTKTYNPYYTITNTLKNIPRNYTDSIITFERDSLFCQDLAAIYNYAFNLDIRDASFSDISYAVNTLVIHGPDAPKEIQDQIMGQLKRKLKEKRRLRDFGIGGMSLTIQYSSLHRVFNNLSFEEGGRFYGAYHQGLPGNLRKHLMINGYPTVELDYSALHPRMLYHQEGINYVDDPYEAICSAPDERNIYKGLLLMSLNAESERSGINAFLKEAKEEGLSGPKIAYKPLLAGLNKFKQHHAPIANYLNTGIGLKLQNKDSQLAEAILIRLMEEDIPCLPVHDSFIVPSHNEDHLRQAMMEEYEILMGYPPMIKKAH